MKTRNSRCCLIAIAGCLVVFAAFAVRVSAASKSFSNIEEALQAQLENVNDFASLTFDLARERYLADRKSGKRRVFTVHKGDRILSFTDGKSTVIALPILPPYKYTALANYCAHYNAWVEWQADQDVKHALKNEVPRRFQWKKALKCAELYGLQQDWGHDTGKDL